MIFSFSPVMMTYRFIDVHIIGWFKGLGWRMEADQGVL